MSTFDTQIHCEEIAGFVPSHNDLIDSLPPAILEASYHRNGAGELWELFTGKPCDFMGWPL